MIRNLPRIASTLTRYGIKLQLASYIFAAGLGIGAIVGAAWMFIAVTAVFRAKGLLR